MPNRRVLEIVRDVDDAKEYAQQIMDISKGDISLMTNPDRALILLYKYVIALETPVVSGHKKKKKKKQ